MAVSALSIVEHFDIIKETQTPKSQIAQWRRCLDFLSSIQMGGDVPAEIMR